MKLGLFVFLFPKAKTLPSSEAIDSKIIEVGLQKQNQCFVHTVQLGSYKNLFLLFFFVAPWWSCCFHFSMEKKRLNSTKERCFDAFLVRILYIYIYMCVCVCVCVCVCIVVPIQAFTTQRGRIYDFSSDVCVDRQFRTHGENCYFYAIILKLHPFL